jgi:uncharacterized protein YheU (UPF0270 family)
MTEKIKFFSESLNNIQNLENMVQDFLRKEREKYGEVEIRESGISLAGITYTTSSGQVVDFKVIFYIRYRTR